MWHRRQVQKKVREILYPLICSFLPCLSWLLCNRVWKSQRDLRITLYIRSRKWNVTKLQNLDIKNKYKKNIAQKLNEIDPSPDTELEWDNLKHIINDVAHDEVGVRKNTKNAGWFDEEFRKSIKAKNEARKKCIIRDTRTSREEYIKRRNEARKICRDKRNDK